jgi:hypothetical protein
MEVVVGAGEQSAGLYEISIPLGFGLIRAPDADKAGTSDDGANGFS